MLKILQVDRRINRKIGSRISCNACKICKREREREGTNGINENIGDRSGKEGGKPVRKSWRKWKNLDGRGDSEVEPSAIAGEAPGRSEPYETVAD